jgi:Secretion system C-terminal sorting domain
MLGAGLLSFHLAVFSQQVAKKISYTGSPDGVIGFLEFRPADYGSQKHPLIIFLHGVGERGNGTSQIGVVAYNAIPLYCAQGASMRFTVNGQTSSFVVISPQLSASYGYWPTYYVKEMIKYAKANLQIDPNRIYVTGLSLGGGGVWRLITDAENFDYSFDSQLAAVAPVCGTQEENDPNYCSTVGANNLPVWAHHSMDDYQVGVGATQHAELLSKNCGVTPAFKATYYQYGGHGGAWLNAYDTGHITRTVIVNGVPTSYTATPNLYEWFLSNSRSTATPAYTPPVAYAGVAQAITLPVNSVTLSGSGTGTNGAIVTGYSWSKISGPASGTISLPLVNTTLVTGLVQGTYVFALTVTDNHGLSSTSNVTVTVNPSAAVNQAPVANAGYDMNIVWPANSVTLNGSGSDPDGYITSYSWTVLSGVAGYSIQNPGAASTTVSNLVAGKYLFNLKVTDNNGATASANVNLNVNVPPVVNTVSNISVTLPVNSVTLDGNGTTDFDGIITGWEWSKTSGPGSYSITNQYAGITSVNSLVQGVYVFTLKVTDNAQGVSTSTVTVTVNPEPGGTAGNPPPTTNQLPVSLAGEDATITLPENSVTLDAGASYDPDGRIIEYYWVQASGPSSSTIANNFSGITTASNLTEGVYMFTLQVKDNNGALAYSVKTVKVAAAVPTVAVNQPPVSNAGADASIILPENSVTLDAGASYDPDGKIIEYYWVQSSGPSSAVITNNFSGITAAGNLSEGVYVFTLQVKDNAGTLAYSIKRVTVTAAPAAPAANQPPVPIVGPDITITIPANNSVALDVTASYDPDGTIVQYYWVQIGGTSSSLINNIFSPTPTMSNLVPGTYIFSLQVKDNAGALAYATKTITLLPPSPTTQTAGNPATLLGYIKMAAGPYQACDDHSADGRIPVYGTSIANGSTLYADAALTQKYDGGWNWFSFTPVLGGTATTAFAIYPLGSMDMQWSCSGSGARINNTQAVAVAEEYAAALQRMKYAAAAAVSMNESHPGIYPNPVRSGAVIELTSTDNNIKTITVYNASGVVQTKYTLNTVAGKNVFALRNTAGLKPGLYIVDIRNSNGTSAGKLRFIKVQ